MLINMSSKDDIFKLSDIKKESSMKKQSYPEKTFKSMAETFKVMSDKTRLKILYVLSKKELCVCDLSSAVNMSVSSVSHQLRILRHNKLVKYRKQGKCVYYSLDDDHVVQLIKMAYDHVTE
jgi:ArsR family transcriptional regulator, lead/cadmium/zinc/bismuth-responsive transcriptional repressor